MHDTKQIARRKFMTGTAAGLAFAGAGRAFLRNASAAAEMKQTQVPGFYRFMLGTYEVTVLSDGSYTLPTDLLAHKQPRDVVKAYLKAHFLDPERRTSHVNIPLINTGDELILVDVGGGANFLEGAGQLIDNMRASGYEPDDVDKVILTHGHPDHIWGLIDDFDELVFPNATYFMSETEWEFWATEKAKTSLPEMFQAFAAGAIRRLPMINDKVTRIKPGTEIAPGIMSIDSAGHTPGHISLAVRSGSNELLISADTVTHPFISFEHPDWWPRTDFAAGQAEKSRRMVLDRAATDRTMLLAYHLSFPGLGNVIRKGGAYRWVPATWQWQL